MGKRRIAVGQPDYDQPERRRHVAAQKDGVPRRQLLTASFLTAAVSVFSTKALAGEVSGDATSQPNHDSSSDEMTAHRRDYYRRARF
jgi:hypothetical protein